MISALAPVAGLIAPLLFIPLIYLLRRWRIGGWLAVGLAVWAAVAVFRFSPTEPPVLLGRTLIIDPIWTHTTALMFVALAVLFTLSQSVSQGWTFFPVGMLVVAFSGLAIAMPHLGIAALLVEVAMLLTIFVVQGGRLDSIRASQRFLSMFTLAVPLFLLAAHQLDIFHDNFDNPAFITQVTLLAAGGFALWLGVAPLHGWISAIAREAQPGISAFVLIVFPATAIILMLRLLANTPWMLSVPNAREILFWGGALSVLVGGLFAATQISLSPLLGYAALFDLGTLIMALGLPHQTGTNIVFFGLIVRAVALVLLGTSTAVLNDAARGESFEALRGLGRSHPVAALGLMLGAATLSGAPLTAGFAARWLAVQSLAGVNARLPVMILVGGFGVSAGYIRGLWALISPLEKGKAPAITPLRWLNRGVILGLMAFVVWVGIFPEKLLTLAQSLAHHLQ